uniref:Cilia- and flagella-associated protein 43 n=2 Tax=Xenopus tropicalis TaxID=8364 RepID=A0A6I8QPX9_XENTR
MSLIRKITIRTAFVRWVQGINKKKVTFINDHTVCYPCGNFIVFHDTNTRKQSFLQCMTGSIGAFSVNTYSEVVAFSDQKLHPSIYVYTFPGFVKRVELKEGAQLDYSLIAFSNAAPYLASFSSVPDHVLTIWNWQEGIPLCSQSESQTTYTTLTFNPMNWHQLCLSSETSLIVWNIEICDNLYQLKAMPVKLPSEDGTIGVEEENFNSSAPNGVSYYGPVMPKSAVAGLVGEEAEIFIPKEQRKHSVQPSFHCWNATSDLYVGCERGKILTISAETQKVIVLAQKDQDADPLSGVTLLEGNIKTMAFHKEGLYIAGKDGVLRSCTIKGSELKLEDCWSVQESIESISFSPNYKMLSIATCKGSVYLYNHRNPGETYKVFDVYSGDLLAADFLTFGNKYCLSTDISGHVQLWSVEDGRSVSSLSLNIQATAMACCPSSNYAAVGSSTGHIYFIDAMKIEALRVVQRMRLYCVPVQHIHFDPRGNFLLTGAADRHIFILDARPSHSFEVLGYIVVCGEILTLSSLSSEDSQQTKAMALICPVNEGKEEKGGTRLEMFSLPLQMLSSPSEYIDEKGMFKDAMVQKISYDVDQPLFSAVLGYNVSSVFGFGSYAPMLLKYVIHKEISGDPLTALVTEKVVRGSHLGPGVLCLSPHLKWISVSGRDGIVYVKDIKNMETVAQVQCHSYHTGGINSLSFSLDGQSIITTGTSDGALVCLQWKSTGSSRLGAAVEYGKAFTLSLQAAMKEENQMLSRMPEWTADTSSMAVESKEKEYRNLSVDVTEQDTFPNTSADVTWIYRKLEEAKKKETEKYAAEKEIIKTGIKKLRKTIQAMMRENESLPDIEKLDQQEFNLDTEEQERLYLESEKEVARVRQEIELENLSKQYLREVIKQECWDSMAVKGRSVMAFHTGYEVMNYPMKERTPKELEDFARVLNLKKIEAVDLKVRKEIVETQPKIKADDEEEVEEESVSKSQDSSSLVGSLSDLYGGDTSYLYSQLILHSREEKINQIILLQDIIHNIKKAFNKDFDIACRQKEQEVTRVKERNNRIQEIMVELNLQEKLLEPTFTDNEKPERALTVDDSEVKVERYLTPEQKAKAEKLAKEEEAKRLAEQEDNAKQRALDDMMGGVLEVKKEDILRMEVPQPGFIARAEAEWTDEEKKQFKEYEKKCKDLSEEKEKYSKVLEAEMKKLQLSVIETTQSFDDVLARLFEKKVKSEMAIYQEELKINNLLFSLLIEEEINTRVAHLAHILDKKRKQKNQTAEIVKSFKTQVLAFRESYDNLVAEDKLLDRGFKKEFSDITSYQVDQLYKLYKRRPRVQRLRTQTDSAAPFGERPGSAKANKDSIALLMKAMDELDTPENMPEGVEFPVWERFCLARRSKIEYEQQVKIKALVLAEMQAFLDKRIEEDEKIRQDTENIMQELNVLRSEKMKFQLDLTVQFLLKQGQVELENSDLIPSFEDAILLHRSVIEDLNSTIRGLGEQKIASMVESKDFRKGIFQLEWEHRKIRMEMEDLEQKSRDISLLHVSKDFQVFLSEQNYDKRISDQIQVLEATLNAQEKQHEKNVKTYKKSLKDLETNINKKRTANLDLDKDLQELLVSFSERKHIYDVVGVEQSTEKAAKERYVEIVQRRKLVDLAKIQAQEIIELRTEVDRLRMKTFPALVQMEY